MSLTLQQASTAGSDREVHLLGFGPQAHDLHGQLHPSGLGVRIRHSSPFVPAQTEMIRAISSEDSLHYYNPQIISRTWRLHGLTLKSMALIKTILAESCGQCVLPPCELSRPMRPYVRPLEDG